MKRIPRLIISLAVPFVAAAIGNLATIPNIPTWYAALEKPILNPPNWVFGPVWTILYFLMGVSLYLFWGTESKQKRWGYILFFGQLALNALWSIVFFGLHQLLLGVIVILLLDCAIIATIILFYKTKRLAAYLLVPYIAWTTFATYLSVSILLLNQ